jgi:hypothetical protein
VLEHVDVGHAGGLGGVRGDLGLVLLPAPGECARRSEGRDGGGKESPVIAPMSLGIDQVEQLRSMMQVAGYDELALRRVHERTFGRPLSRLEDLTEQELEHWIGLMDYALRRRALDSQQEAFGA